ncbi:fibulin-1-like [Paramacrobiotus metropolitanus]|nr:fibulin-1-like [Paramacrobiotus metropolitanus]
MNTRAGRCEDIDECAMNIDNCETGMRCENEPGTFRCIREVSCGTGYTFDAHRRECIDNDECVLGNHNCGLAYECINTQGSFRCTPKRCPKKMRLDYERGQCIHVDCPPGFEPNDEGNCGDVNECASRGACKRNQDCFNTVGSFMCRDMLNCGGGYLMNEEGTRCNDVDECADGTHTCVGGQRCENRPGSYYCSCVEGFEFDNSRKECVDIDECKRYGLSACVLSADCENFPGSFRCICKDGFRQTADNNCQDIDECEEHNPCQQGCINTWGGYNCTCRTGFKLGADNRSCDDIDECKEQTTHQLCFGDCINVPGGYNCTCPSGFRMLPDGRNCQDIDECKDEQQCSRSDQICTNLEGSFHCHTVRCPPGYIQDQDQKNRCRRRSLVCPIGDSACLHQPISFSYNFMAIPSKPVFPPNGRIDLFTMRGPQQPHTNVEFNLELKNTRLLVPTSKPADRRFFDVRSTGFNQATISLVRAFDPQEVDLEMQMSMTTNGVFSGKAVANIVIIVMKTRSSDFIPLR